MTISKLDSNMHVQQMMRPTMQHALFASSVKVGIRPLRLPRIHQQRLASLKVKSIGRFLAGSRAIDVRPVGLSDPLIYFQLFLVYLFL